MYNNKIKKKLTKYEGLDFYYTGYVMVVLVHFNCTIDNKFR